MDPCIVIYSVNWINVFLHTHLQSLLPSGWDPEPEEWLNVISFATHSHYVSIKRTAAEDKTFDKHLVYGLQALQPDGVQLNQSVNAVRSNRGVYLMHFHTRVEKY